MDTLVLTNNGNSPLYVNDLGIEILVGEDFDLLQSFTAEDIIESYDFPSIYAQGAQVVLTEDVGTSIMSLQDVYDYLTPLTKWSKLDYAYISGKDDNTNVTGSELEELTNGSTTNLHNHDNRYYTETELQTPGAAQIHYSNIIGSPTGNFRVENGDLYFSDPTRQGKWLSAAEEKYVWTEKKVDGKYMSIGHVSSSNTGYLLPQDFTITKIAVTSSGQPDKQLQIRLNNNTTFSFNLSSGQYISTILNVDAYTNDILKVFVSGSGGKISNVVVTLFGKWRII